MQIGVFSVNLVLAEKQSGQINTGSPSLLVRRPRKAGSPGKLIEQPVNFGMNPDASILCT
jgi:hypothetical protein